MHSTSATALAEILDAQACVISFAQVVAAGCDPELPQREVAAGRWQRVCRGVFLASSEPATDLQQAWCAQLAGGPGSVVTGRIICRMRGVADVPDLAMAVLVDADVRRRPGPAVQCLRTERLPTVEARADGLRLAPIPRAVVDAARQCSSLRDIRGLLMAAMNAKHATTELLRNELDAGPRRGSGPPRRALQDWADGARSAPEAEVADELRRLVWAGSMPPFLLNPEVYDGAVLVGSPDVYVPGRSLGAETDSHRHHGAVQDGEATLARHVTFADYGIRLEHASPRRFRQGPAVWAAQFAAVAEQRRGLGDPAGLRIEPIGPLQPVRGRRRAR